MTKRPGGPLAGSSSPMSKSVLFPLLSGNISLTTKGYLAPAVTSVVFIVVLTAFMPNLSIEVPLKDGRIIDLAELPPQVIAKIRDSLPPQTMEEINRKAVLYLQRLPYFFYVLAAYLSLAGYYVMYRLCGKPKPWGGLLGITLITAILTWAPLPSFPESIPYSLRAALASPFTLILGIFCNPATATLCEEAMQPSSFGGQFVDMLLAAALPEELFKILPVLAAFWLTRFLDPPSRERIGVNEPLDGILLGAASGIGFMFAETMGGFVPNSIDTYSELFNPFVGQLFGLQLLIPRVLLDLCGHLAYSGYLGYFVGLCALKPAAQRLPIFAVGYVTAATMHAFWNSAGFFGPLGLIVAGALAYACFAAAILKGRQISPTRSQNFATQVIGIGTTARFSLDIGGQQIPLYESSRLSEKDIPGLESSLGNGVIAEVNRNPQDPTILGLKNLSRAYWTVHSLSGLRQINVGQSIKLSVGDTIDFGKNRGEIK